MVRCCIYTTRKTLTLNILCFQLFTKGISFYDVYIHLRIRKMIKFKFNTPEELEAFEEIGRCQRIGRSFLVINKPPTKDCILLTGEEVNLSEYVKEKEKKTSYTKILSDDTVFSRIIQNSQKVRRNRR